MPHVKKKKKQNRWRSPRPFTWAFSQQYIEAHPSWYRVQSRLKALLAPNLEEDAVFWHSSLFFDSALTGHLREQRGSLFQHLFAEVPEKEHNWSMRVSGHSLTPPHHKKPVFGHKWRKSRPSAMLLKHLLCEAVAWATVEALLGSEARSWRAAFWYGTDD